MHYTILNATNNEVHKFSTVRKAVAYMKSLKNDTTEPTKDEVIDVCNIFAKYKNKIAINGVSK